MKGFNPKEIKTNAAEIIKAGAALYDALGVEPELREDRARAVAGHVDSDFVETSIQEAISQVGRAARLPANSFPVMCNYLAMATW